MMQHNSDASSYCLSANSLVEFPPSAAIPTNSRRLSSMSSRPNNASSTPSTARCGTRAPAPKGDRDVPPANAGWYAAPTTMGRDVDLQPPSGAGDASPANLGWYATAATTARDDDPTHKKKVMIQTLIEDRQHRSNKINYVLGALRLTLDKKELKAVFPRRIVEHPSDTQHERERFAFHPDYIHHLVSVMRLSSEVLNNFLQAAGSKLIFSYGTSKYYEGQTFEEVLHRERPAQTVALTFEKRLLDRITTAYRAISSFVLHADDASMDLPTFASRRPSTLQGKDSIITCPTQEDLLWTGEVADQVQAALNLVISENGDKPPSATEPSTQPCKVDCLLNTRLSSTPLLEQRSPDSSAIPESIGFQTYINADVGVNSEAQLQPHLTPSITTRLTTHRPPIVERSLQLCDADEASIELQATCSNCTPAVRPLRDPDKLPATEVSAQLHDLNQLPRPRLPMYHATEPRAESSQQDLRTPSTSQFARRPSDQQPLRASDDFSLERQLLPTPPLATIPTLGRHVTAEEERRSLRSHKVEEIRAKPRTADQEQAIQPLCDPDKPSASLYPPAGNDSCIPSDYARLSLALQHLNANRELAFKRIKDLLNMRGPQDSEPRTEDQPQNRDSRMLSTPRLALHSLHQLGQPTNREASFGPLRILKDIQLVPALRRTNRQDPWIAGLSDSLQMDCPAISRPVNTGLAPTPVPRDELSDIVSGFRSRQVIHKTYSRHDPPTNKKGTSTLVKTSQRTLESLDSTAISPSDLPCNKENFLSFTNVADILGVGEKHLKDEPYRAAKLLFTSTSDGARLATTFVHCLNTDNGHLCKRRHELANINHSRTSNGKDKSAMLRSNEHSTLQDLHEREDPLSFTNDADILEVSEKYLGDELYQTAKLLFTSISSWVRLATTLIYLDENPFATGPSDLALHYRSYPQPAGQEPATRPLRDPDKTSTFRVPHPSVSQARQADNGLRTRLGRKAITSQASHEVWAIRTPPARLGTPDRQYMDASNGSILNRWRGLADTQRPRDPGISSSDCHRRPNLPPERRHNYAEEGYLQVKDGILPPLSDVFKILAYCRVQLRPTTATPARQASANQSKSSTTADVTASALPEAQQLATSIFRFVETPVATGSNDRARYYPASPLPTNQEPATQPLRDPDKSSQSDYSTWISLSNLTPHAWANQDNMSITADATASVLPVAQLLVKTWVRRSLARDSLLPMERVHDQDVVLPLSTTTIWRRQACGLKIPCPWISEGLTTSDEHVPGRREYIGPCSTISRVPPASANSHYYPAPGTSDPVDVSKPRNLRTASIPRIARLSSHQVYPRTASNAFGRRHDLVDPRALHFWRVKDNRLAEPAGRPASSVINNGVAVHACDYDSLVTRQEYVLTLAMPIDDLAFMHDCNLTIGYHSLDFSLEIFSRPRTLVPDQYSASNRLLTSRNKIGATDVTHNKSSTGRTGPRPLLAATSGSMTLPCNLETTRIRLKYNVEPASTSHETLTRQYDDQEVSAHPLMRKDEAPHQRRTRFKRVAKQSEPDALRSGSEKSSRIMRAAAENADLHELELLRESPTAARSTGSPSYYTSQTWAGSKPQNSQAPASPRIAQHMLNQFHPRTGDKASCGRLRDFTDSRALRLSGMEDNLLASPIFNSDSPPRVQLPSPEPFSRLRVFTSARCLSMNWPPDNLREIATINCTPASTDTVDNREAANNRFCKAILADKDTMAQTIASAGAAELPYDGNTLTCYHVPSVYPTFIQRQTTEGPKYSARRQFESYTTQISANPLTTRLSHEASKGQPRDFDDTPPARASCSSGHQLLLDDTSLERTHATERCQWRIKDKLPASRSPDSSSSLPPCTLRFNCLKANSGVSLKHRLDYTDIGPLQAQVHDTAQRTGPRAPCHSDILDSQHPKAGDLATMSQAATARNSSANKHDESQLHPDPTNHTTISQPKHIRALGETSTYYSIRSSHVRDARSTSRIARDPLDLRHPKANREVSTGRRGDVKDTLRLRAVCSSDQQLPLDGSSPKQAHCQHPKDSDKFQLKQWHERSDTPDLRSIGPSDSRHPKDLGPPPLGPALDRNVALISSIPPPLESHPATASDLWHPRSPEARTHKSEPYVSLNARTCYDSAVNKSGTPDFACSCRLCQEPAEPVAALQSEGPEISTGSQGVLLAVIPSYARGARLSEHRFACKPEASTGRRRNREDTQQLQTFCSSDRRPKFLSMEQTCKFELPQAPRLPSLRVSRHQSTAIDPHVYSTNDPTEQQESWIPSASDIQLNDSSVVPRHVDAGSSPIPFPLEDLAAELSAMACSNCVHSALCYSDSRLCRDLAVNKCRTSTFLATSRPALEPTNYTTISRLDSHQASTELSDTCTAEPKCPCNALMSTPSVKRKPNLSTEDEPLMLYPANGSAVEITTTLLGAERDSDAHYSRNEEKTQEPEPLALSRHPDQSDEVPSHCDASCQCSRNHFTWNENGNSSRSRKARSPSIHQHSTDSANREVISSDCAQALDKPTADGYAITPRHSSAHKSQANEEDERLVPQFDPSKPIKSLKLFAESSTSNSALDSAVKALTKPTISSAEPKAEVRSAGTEKEILTPPRPIIMRSPDGLGDVYRPPMSYSTADQSGIFSSAQDKPLELKKGWVRNLCEAFRLVLSDIERKSVFTPSDTLNDLLQAIGQPRSFPFGNSFFDGKRSFTELIRSDWAVKTVASAFETRLLRRIQTASDVIHILRSHFDINSAQIASRLASQTPDNSSANTWHTQELTIQSDISSHAHDTRLSELQFASALNNAQWPASPQREDDARAMQVVPSHHPASDASLGATPGDPAVPAITLRLEASIKQSEARLAMPIDAYKGRMSTSSLAHEPESSANGEPRALQVKLSDSTLHLRQSTPSLMQHLSTGSVGEIPSTTLSTKQALVRLINQSNEALRHCFTSSQRAHGNTTGGGNRNLSCYQNFQSPATPQLRTDPADCTVIRSNCTCTSNHLENQCPKSSKPASLDTIRRLDCLMTLNMLPGALLNQAHESLVSVSAITRKPQSEINDKSQHIQHLSNNSITIWKRLRASRMLNSSRSSAAETSNLRMQQASALAGNSDLQDYPPIQDVDRSGEDPQYSPTTAEPSS